MSHIKRKFKIIAGKIGSTSKGLSSTYKVTNKIVLIIMLQNAPVFVALSQNNANIIGKNKVAVNMAYAIIIMSKIPLNVNPKTIPNRPIANVEIFEYFNFCCSETFFFVIDGMISFVIITPLMSSVLLAVDIATANNATNPNPMRPFGRSEERRVAKEWSCKMDVS